MLIRAEGKPRATHRECNNFPTSPQHIVKRYAELYGISNIQKMRIKSLVGNIWVSVLLSDSLLLSLTGLRVLVIDMICQECNDVEKSSNFVEFDGIFNYDADGKPESLTSLGHILATILAIEISKRIVKMIFESEIK